MLQNPVIRYTQAGQGKIQFLNVKTFYKKYKREKVVRTERESCKDRERKLLGHITVCLGLS